MDDNNFDECVVRCGACKEILSESPSQPAPAEPCPHCGSTLRAIKSVVSDRITPRDDIKGKVKDPNKRSADKERVKFESGYNLHKQSGKWNVRERIYDRNADRYTKTIKNGETGEVLQHVDKPLHEHRGHGSAKKKGKLIGRNSSILNQIRAFLSRIRQFPVNRRSDRGHR